MRNAPAASAPLVVKSNRLHPSRHTTRKRLACINYIHMLPSMPCVRQPHTYTCTKYRFEKCQILEITDTRRIVRCIDWIWFEFIRCYLLFLVLISNQRWNVPYQKLMWVRSFNEKTVTFVDRFICALIWWHDLFQNFRHINRNGTENVRKVMPMMLWRAWIKYLRKIGQ